MDIDHYYSGDVNPSATGDLATVDALTESAQKVIRRVLTNPGDYIQHPDYGAGAPQHVGGPNSKLGGLQSKILSQLLQEPSVAVSPTPQVTLRGDKETVYITIKYVETSTNTMQVLSFDTAGV